MRKISLLKLVFICLIFFSMRLYAVPGTVTLNLPVNLAAGVSIEAALSWNSVPEAAVYRLQIATTDTFAAGSIKFDDSTLTGLSKTLNLPSERLENNKHYFWRVAAKDSAGNWGSYSAVRSFYTTIAVMPYLSYPIGGDVVYYRTVNLTWYTDPYSAGVKFDVYYSKSISSGQLVSPVTLASNITALTKAFPGLEDGTKYYWQVRSKTSTGAVASYSAIDSFMTSEGTGGAVVPVPSWPVDSATVYTTSPGLYWYLGTVNPGLQFMVFYSTTPGAGEAASHTAWINSMNTVLPGLTPGGHYYWMVKSRLKSDTSKVSALSAEADFKVDGGTALTAQVPVPAWPVGGAPIYSTSARLCWYLNSYVPGLKYQVQYNIKGGSAVTTKWVAANYINISDLTAGEIYEWKVRSSTDTTSPAAASAYSAVDSFSVALTVTQAPVVPTLSWPVGGATIYSATPGLYWYLGQAAPFELQYEVLYSTESGFPADTNKTFTLGPVTKMNVNIVKPLTPGTTYYWKVRSRIGEHGVWGEYSAYESFTVNASAPVEVLQPVIYYPSEGAVISSTSPKLAWWMPGSPAGLKYKLQLSSYPFNESYLIIDTDTLSQMSFTAAGLAPGATYSWRVYSYEAGNIFNISAPSDIVTFTVSAGASALYVPLAGGPVGGVKLTGVWLNWYLPAASPQTKYEVQYSANKDMSQAAVITGIESRKLYLNKELKAGTTYYWRVRGVDAQGNTSGYSRIESFIPSFIVGVEKTDNGIIPSKFEVSRNYPNPFNPSTAIKVSLPVTSLVTVKIYNMLGQEVRTLLSAQVSAGTHTLVWHGEDNSGNILPSGSYIYRVTAGQNVTSGKMMFLK